MLDLMYKLHSCTISLIAHRATDVALANINQTKKYFLMCTYIKIMSNCIKGNRYPEAFLAQLYVIFLRNFPVVSPYLFCTGQ